jgi:hypothetical protein
MVEWEEALRRGRDPELLQIQYNEKMVMQLKADVA